MWTGKQQDHKGTVEKVKRNKTYEKLPEINFGKIEIILPDAALEELSTDERYLLRNVYCNIKREYFIKLD